MYIHIIYINAHVHQGLNPRPYKDAPKSLPPNHCKTLITFKKSLLCLAWNYLEFKIRFLSKFIQIV